MKPVTYLTTIALQCQVNLRGHRKACRVVSTTNKHIHIINNLQHIDSVPF